MRKQTRRFPVLDPLAPEFTSMVEFDASRESVELVLSAPIEGAEDGPSDGRSPFKWFMLPNGDWILGVWPYGDTYMATERDREFD